MYRKQSYKSYFLSWRLLLTKSWKKGKNADGWHECQQSFCDARNGHAAAGVSSARPFPHKDSSGPRRPSCGKVAQPVAEASYRYYRHLFLYCCSVQQTLMFRCLSLLKIQLFNAFRYAIASFFMSFDTQKRYFP